MLIGTSTNLLVDGVARDLGLTPFGIVENLFLDFVRIGDPMNIIIVVVAVFVIPLTSPLSG